MSGFYVPFFPHLLGYWRLRYPFPKRYSHKMNIFCKGLYVNANNCWNETVKIRTRQKIKFRFLPVKIIMKQSF
jgi:hypothetical protein